MRFLKTADKDPDDLKWLHWDSYCDAHNIVDERTEIQVPVAPEDIDADGTDMEDFSIELEIVDEDDSSRDDDSDEEDLDEWYKEQGDMEMVFFPRPGTGKGEKYRIIVPIYLGFTKAKEELVIRTVTSVDLWPRNNWRTKRDTEHSRKKRGGRSRSRGRVIKETQRRKNRKHRPWKHVA